MEHTKKAPSIGKLLLAGGATVQTILLLILVYDSVERGNIKAVHTACAAILIICAETIYLFKTITYEINSAYEEEYMRLTKHQNEFAQIRQQSLSLRAEEIQRIKENMFDTLSRMDDFLQQKSSDESSAQSFHSFAGDIKSMIDQTKKTIWCDNTVVNIVIEDKKRIADQYNIRMDAVLDVPENLPVSLTDLCSVFANLLDNALEAAGYMDDNKKWISIKATVISGYFVLKVENSCQPDVKRRGEQRIFRRKAGEIHGIGLRIVKKTAEKYGGKLLTEEKNGIFRAIVYMEHHKKEAFEK